MALAYDAPRSGSDRARAGMYESHYVKAADPDGGRAVWLRHTVLSRPDGGGQRTTVWLTVFDRTAGTVVEQRRVTDEAGYVAPATGWSQAAQGTLGPTGADGAMEDATWTLRWDPVDAESVPYLPKRWLYDRAIPRSNGVALLPFARMAGTVAIGEHRIELDGWPGMIGHNWGSDHALHWVWMHAAGIGPAGAAWFDGALARVPTVAGRVSPWLGAGAVMLDGARRRVAMRGAALTVSPGVGGDAVHVQARVDGGRLDVHATLPADETVAWDYAAPHDDGRRVRNCSIAEGRVVLTTPTATTEIPLDGVLALELGEPA
ncbi:hypothetical protein [Paraconexibacter sp.]|uniref:hypothetical protein n=1 Tax=Paraconexibacter sp. TaxID=2949640 RepID=UPI0035630BBB